MKRNIRRPVLKSSSSSHKNNIHFSKQNLQHLQNQPIFIYLMSVGSLYSNSSCTMKTTTTVVAISSLSLRRLQIFPLYNEPSSSLRFFLTIKLLIQVSGFLSLHSISPTNPSLLLRGCELSLKTIQL
jgi:hypothetical protein